MSNLIYAYKKKDSNKIVYVGQTIDLKTRNKQHLEYDPFNVNTKEYNYSLSRGIRKYGKDAYELVILEDNLLQEQLNEREKYWIAFYNTYWNGYNQTIGGTFPTKPIFTEDKIDLVIEMLKDESYSYQDIKEKTGISMTHIYNINIGARRRRDNINYPIRDSKAKGSKGSIFSQEEVLKIHNILKNTKVSINQIAADYGCNPSTISKINKGQTKQYRIENWEYPIRDNSNMKRN